MRPEVLESALSNNRIENVIAAFNVASGVSIAAFDAETGVILGSSQRDLIGKRDQNIGIASAYLENGSLD